MNIRRAKQSDCHPITLLLNQVLMVHNEGRPDLFRSGTRKYTDDELKALIGDDKKPIFVAVDEDENVLGYAFTIFQQYLDNNILTDVKTLYIDDLCVDEACRGQKIGKELYDYVLDFAKENQCYNVTLNVWACNQNAHIFYEKLGMQPQKYGMEKIL